MWSWAIGICTQGFLAAAEWFENLMASIPGAYFTLLGLFALTVIVGMIILPLRGMALSNTIKRATKPQSGKGKTVKSKKVRTSSGKASGGSGSSSYGGAYKTGSRRTK